MATVTLNSVTTISGFKPFRGLHEAVITKTIRNFCDRAVIKLPTTAVLKEGPAAQTKSVLTANQFKRGDKINIQLGYNGQLKEEFEGFIARVNKSNPCQIECEGYAFLLREKTVNKVWKGTTLKAVLQEIVSGTNIKLDPQIPDATLDRVELIKMSGFKALEEFRKQTAGAFAIWFDKDVLYAGLAFALLSDRNRSGKADVKYKIGYNVVRDGQMKERMAGQDAYDVELVFTDKSGKKTKAKAGVPNSNAVVKRIQAIRDSGLLKKAASEIEQGKNYNGYDGSITAFLVPYCKPGQKMEIEDPRYPERSGNYLIESTEVRYGMSGARRVVGISIRL